MLSVMESEKNAMPNDMAKRGWRDQATASLNRWKAELGFRDRNDIQTFFDLYDADEGREIGSSYPPDL